MEILVKTIFSGAFVFAQALARGARARRAQDERERAEKDVERVPLKLPRALAGARKTRSQDNFLSN